MQEKTDVGICRVYVGCVLDFFGRMGEVAADLCFAASPELHNLHGGRRGFTKMHSPVRTPEPEDRNSVAPLPVMMVSSQELQTERFIDEDKVEKNNKSTENPQEQLFFVHHQVISTRSYDYLSLF